MDDEDELSPLERDFPELADKKEFIESLKKALTRPLSDAEMELLLKNFAFLRISNPEAKDSDFKTPPDLRVDEKSGCTVHDHGSELATKVSEWAYGAHASHEKIATTTEDKLKGTLDQKIIDVTHFMANIAFKEKKWQNMKIDEQSNSIMKVALSIAAEGHGVSLDAALTNEQAKRTKRILERMGIDAKKSMPHVERPK